MEGEMGNSGTPPKAALVLLTLNEIDGLKALFDRLPRKAFEELFAVDGGSTDGTTEYLRERGIRVVPQERRGRGEAFRVAVASAEGDHLVFYSPDGNEDPDDILPLLQKLREGVDMAVASRFLPGARDEDAGKIFPIRRWGNLMFSWVANRLWNRETYITDTINGFRAVTKSAFLKMNPTALRFPIEFQMSIRAMKLGLKVAQLPTHEKSRIGGRSKAGTFRTGWELCRVLWDEFWSGPIRNSC